MVIEKSPEMTIFKHLLSRVGTYEIAPSGALLRHAKDADTPLAAPPLAA